MKPLSIFRRQAICLALLVCSSQAGAGLLVNDAQLRSDLAWLADRDIIQLNLATWPLSQEEVNRALSNANAPRTVANQETLARVQRRLAELKAPLRLNGWTHSASPSLPQGFDDTPTSAHGLGAALASSGEFWDINLQGQAESHQYINDASHYNLNGAYAGVKLFNQWLAFGEIPQWWGPGNDGSTIRSDAARPVVGFILQRAEQTPFDTPWLAWLGSWQYQLSAGQLRQYQRPEEPKLIGGRLTASPFNLLDVGMSRMLMWGGKGRPNTLDSFGDALLGRDNTGSQDRDPGDQMAGIDFRLKLLPLTGLPLSLYGQITGDDQAGILPSHNTFVGGIEGHQSLNLGQVNWFLEAADTRSSLKDTGIIYYHYCYHGGYYQQGAPLGDAMGGDGTQYSGRVELVLENQQRLSTRLVWARVNRTSQSINQAYPASATMKGIALGWSVPVNAWATVETGFWSGTADTGMSAGFRLTPSL
ncbi:capsule assembly Wzi family protein [Scandinavium lactucae]|uniref:Capsule assembly Wzi family protein n=1 Tax=Scandinavium lactucae TaxID=3095028 RepID=A0ABU4QJW2_9ENTR|nr:MULTISPECIES: capsule assembly Wzi family protein [unclassified Scandinavium]MDX6039055.1 capsule assembly Wzi family protein [Scandinavium sp. V105_6]MDX6050126.1 capsule assembly Wzi family protein [Scandinavium sp. V105_1]